MTALTSTAYLSNSLVNTIRDLQTRLARAQQELSTGRHADPATTLGFRLGDDYAIGLNLNDIKTITATNDLVTARLTATDAALKVFAKDAADMKSSLVVAQSNANNAAALAAKARAALGALTSGLNTSDGSTFIFGGLKSNAPPMSDYFSTTTSPAKQAVDQAFFNAFGTTQSGAGVSSITAAQMQSFLSGPFAALFTPANWSANWSSASSQAMESRISISQTVTTSVTANDPALQKLAMGYVMLSDLSADQLNSAAYQTVVQTAMQYIDQGQSALTQMQANVGVMKSQVTGATQTMSVQDTLLTGQISAFEDVDATEVSTTISSLMTQLETAYSLTARIQQLSLSKYI